MLQTTHAPSLQDKIAQFDSPLQMLRSASAVTYTFVMPSHYTTSRDEQRVWRNTCVIYDQSDHMADVYFEGRDVRRLFSEVGVNDPLEVWRRQGQAVRGGRR
jgi:vanillate/3-O-methylgallate O-demethylase